MPIGSSPGVDLGLRDRVFVVTGAGGGIGRAVAQQFAEAGGRIVAVDMAQEAVDATVSTLDDPSRHAGLALDLTRFEELPALFAEVVQKFERFDGLVHLAAVLRRHWSIDDVTEEDWDFHVDVNLKATFFISRAAANALRSLGRGGSITNFASQSWWTGGTGGSVVYAATKGGVVSMSRGLARTYASSNIRVNTIAPGITETPMLLSDLNEQQLQEQIDTVLLKRMAAPAEIAGAAVFLASDLAQYVTGATLNVTGGQIVY